MGEPPIFLLPPESGVQSVTKITLESNTLERKGALEVQPKILCIHRVCI
jgi:hypothetical protein